ncbi:MAG TPA: capsule assembly Wzi family protein [Terriglobales bacterium]
MAAGLCLVLLGPAEVPQARAQDSAQRAASQTAGTPTQPPDSQQAQATPQTQTQSGTTPANQAKDERGYLQPGEDPENRLLTPFVKHIVGDQKEFWTAPTRFQVKDLKWIVPFAGVTAAFIASDSWWSKQVNPNHVQTSLHISDYTTYGLMAGDAGAFLLGQITHDDHVSEAGLLGGEATINAVGVTYLFKAITQRERPLTGNGNGDFFYGGSSFPSQHAAIAWSIASVMAHEYPGWLTQLLAYSAATAVTTTRVTASQHFPSDAIVGSALGWYFGRQVYRAHHDPEVGGSGWGPLIEEKPGEKTRNPKYMASPYVALESWIYPALERLIALGYLQSNMLGIRPWTRMACAQMLEDASDKFSGDDLDTEAGKTYAALRSEFGTEMERLDGAANVGARVESIYTRGTQISGTPVRDGYHFGETIINDYGRPYWQGFNNITGVTADSELGPVAFSFQGEYQHAPAMPSYGQATLQAIAATDQTPPTPNGIPRVDQFELLNSAASVMINNVQLSFGVQSMWLGPAESTSLIMSNNAAPFPMLKVDTVSPFYIPGFSRIFGPVRTETYLGQLSGQHWETCTTCQQPYPKFQYLVGPNISPQPFISGSKISFTPTPNLETGFSFAAMFGGPGLPITFGNFFRTFYLHTPNLANNPGKRLASADFTYRVPGIRDWLTLYLDSMTWDELSPIGSTRASTNAGMFMPKLPKLSKLQLRVEGFNIARNRQFAPGWVYYNFDRYRSGYINAGNLMGAWYGRGGRGVQSWLTYSLSPRNHIQLGYRLESGDPRVACVQAVNEFCQGATGATEPGGGRMADYSASSDFTVARDLSLSAMVQYEQYRYVALNANRQSDVTASLQLTYWPKWKTRW